MIQEDINKEEEKEKEGDKEIEELFSGGLRPGERGFGLENDVA